MNPAFQKRGGAHGRFFVIFWVILCYWKIIKSLINTNILLNSLERILPHRYHGGWISLHDFLFPQTTENSYWWTFGLVTNFKISHTRKIKWEKISGGSFFFGKYTITSTNLIIFRFCTLWSVETRSITRQICLSYHLFYIIKLRTVLTYEYKVIIG